MGLHAVICAVNSKYIHSSLAPWYLKAAVTNPEVQVTVEEATVNEKPEAVLQRLLAHHPRVLGFSCYIWNYSYVKALLLPLREALPETIFLLGGPQVSYQAAEVLKELSQADYILSGEGEEPFAVFLDAILRGAAVKGLPGLCGRGYTAPPYISEKEPPCPYTAEYVKALKGRIAYLETSRGCPFSCAFCLSGRCGPARFFCLERAKRDLLTLANAGAQTVKLVDRTFNANPARAAALVEFICAHYGSAIPAGVCFHFEIAGDILTEVLIAAFGRAPKGALQVEIGLQSFSADILEAVSRRTDLDRLEQNVRRLLAQGNLHVHMDLIAGLPGETLQGFIKGFNRAFALHPHMLQLGFLKLLPGSPMAEAPAGTFSLEPPYEVQETPWLSKADLNILHHVEDALERLWNSGRFCNAVCYVLTASGLKPYALFLRFAQEAGDTAGIRLDDFTERVFRCFSALVSPETLCDIMTEEWLAVNSSCRLPPCLFRESMGKHLRFLDQKKEMKRQPGVKRAAARLAAAKALIWVDYNQKDPVTGRYRVNRRAYEE